MYANVQRLREWDDLKMVRDPADLQQNIRPGDGVRVLARGLPVWLQVERVDGQHITATVTKAERGAGIEVGELAELRLEHIAQHIRRFDG